jgi:hypothetical protein
MTKRAKSLLKGKKQKAKTGRARVVKKVPAKSAVKSTGKRGVAAADALDALVAASARALALPLEPAWRPAVRANLDVTLRLAALFMDFPLPDEAEPAPVFVA